MGIKRMGNVRLMLQADLPMGLPVHATLDVWWKPDDMLDVEAQKISVGRLIEKDLSLREVVQELCEEAAKVLANGTHKVVEGSIDWPPPPPNEDEKERTDVEVEASALSR